MCVGVKGEDFFFNDTATTEIYTLSLHDALPIFSHRRAPALSVRRGARRGAGDALRRGGAALRPGAGRRPEPADRKSTRLNSSHANISYAVFCLKKKKTLPILSLSPSCFFLISFL